MDLYEKNADGSGEETLLWKSDQDKIPTSWSRDGRFLLFESNDPKMAQDLWILRLSDRKAYVFLRTEVREEFGQFSPDGRWIAYDSPLAGKNQVYVRPFSPESESAAGPADPQWIVSTNSGGIYPRWSGDGKRLYYRPDVVTALMAADLVPGTSFQNDPPRRLFGDVPRRYWDVSQDNQFLFKQEPAPTGPPPPFTVVLNWMAGLKK